MTYESLNDLESDWYKLGHLEIVTENGNMSVKSNKALTPMQAAEILACVWNQIPKMVEEMRLLAGDHERMSTFLRTIQQISVDAMRCTSKMERVVDWYQAIPAHVMREMDPADIIFAKRGLEAERPGAEE
ncbi:MAG: hypothetical protein KH197_03190 [Clostridiales bacterium]|jgi:hypothetical protein|nr:hypothetical protein [Clostridiales bacterium]